MVIEDVLRPLLALAISEQNKLLHGRGAPRSGLDGVAVDSIANLGAVGRVQTLEHWLRKYKVLGRFVRPAAAHAALDYLDGIPALVGTPAQKRLLIIQYVDAMRGILRINHPSVSDVFASKALWLKFPDDVAIKDSHAEKALTILSKIAPTSLPILKVGGYANFANYWYQLYDIIEPEILVANAIPRAVCSYPYTLRILDKTLWFLGKPSYGI